MDKSALLKALVLSEKTHAIVAIKTIHAEKPIRGFVEKVLNQIIILRSPAESPVTLTFADIESVVISNQSQLERVFQNIRKTLHKSMRFS